MASRWAIVVVPFFEANDGDAFLDLFWNQIPPKGEQQRLDSTSLDLVAALFGGAAGSGTAKILASAFYTYSGSLTTPPCSENARYFLLKAEAYPHRISLAQVTEVQRLLGSANARPVQNDRWAPASDPTGRLQVLTKAEWTGNPVNAVVSAAASQAQSPPQAQPVAPIAPTSAPPAPPATPPTYAPSAPRQLDARSADLLNAAGSDAAEMMGSLQ